MISKLAIDKFLRRRLRDSGRAKRFSDRALDLKLERHGFVFATRPLRWAQKICMLLGWKHRSYLFLMGMGGGKTKLIIDLFVNRRRQKLLKANRCLVLVPNIVNLGEWEDQVAAHSRRCTIKALDVSGERARRAIIDDQAIDFVICTYQGMCQLCSIRAQKKKGRKTRWGWKMSGVATDRIARQFGMLVLDECTAVMNPAGLPFSVVRRMRHTIDTRYGLTGTPFDKDPMALWSQLYFIDKGYSLGETLGLFRGVFFNREEDRWGVVHYKPRESRKPELTKRLRHSAIRFSEDECQDLPDAIGGLDHPLIVPVKLTAEQRPYYNSLKSDLLASRGNYELVDSVYTRMRMVCSGWIGAKTEDGEKVEIVFKSNPKLDALIWKLREIDEHEKVVVIHWFNVSGHLVAERLKKEKIPFLWVYGRTPATKRRELMDSFKSRSGPRVLLASTAIAHGANLQIARYMSFFESPDSVILRRQLQARVRREGGTKGVRYFHDYVTRGTVESKILRSMREGLRLHDLLVDRKEQFSTRLQSRSV